ncbi:MAG: hypothetical protein ACC651_16310 [Candidatus Scalindua sp.]
MTEEELLGEVEDLIRNMPVRSTIRHDTEENFSWLGRVSAVIEEWDAPKTLRLNLALAKFQGVMARASSEGFREIITLLHQARHSLRMKTVGPVNVAINNGGVFDYFDELRKIIETGTSDLLFIDPYLDAEFVSRYLGSVTENVSIRLLAREKIATLLPAVHAFMGQHGAQILVRTSPGFHDRYVIVDGNSCYQSGASFKDGAKRSPTTLTQITDAFPAIQKTYEDLWSSGNIEI